MAELGALYDATPVTRSACDIFPANDTERRAATDGPTVTNKWLVASVGQDAATVIARVFDEADLVRVVEYLRKATWSLHPEADPAAEQWVRRRALAILNGNAPS